MFKAKRLVLIVAAVFLALFLLGSFIQRGYVVPVLMYHSISYRSDPIMHRLIVSPDTFQRQMRFLKERRYNVVSLEKIAVLVKQKKKLLPRTIAITFDDGFKDNYDYAFPILKKYNLPATIFVIINEIGRRQGDRLSWEQIREMSGSGVISIGSHGLMPEPLVNLKSEAELKKEIFDSKKIIEEKLGKSVSAFCYPEGGFNPRIKELVGEAGYRVAVATSPGKEFPNDDIFALKRLRISETSRNLFVFWIQASGFYTFIKERRDKN